MKKNRFYIWLIVAFLAGVLACHFFYYSASYIADRRISHQIDSLKLEYERTRNELDQIDSLLNNIR